MDNNSFQSIDEQNNVFEKIDENIDENIEEESVSTNLFVTGLPDWDLEPLYETVKRRDEK